MKKKVCRKGFLLGYWKGERVALIPKYHPDSKSEDYVIEEVEVKNGDLYPRIIDPSTTTLSEIREVCEYNDRPFWWITGINPRNPEATKIQPNFTLGQAIEYFITFKSAGTTTAQYRRIFNDLIKQKILDPGMLVGQYEELFDHVRSLVLKLSDGKTYNDKVFNIIVSFHGYLSGKSIFSRKKDTIMIDHAETIEKAIAQFIAFEEDEKVRDDYRRVFRAFLGAGFFELATTVGSYKADIEAIDFSIEIFLTSRINAKEEYLIFQLFHTLLFHGRSKPKKYKKAKLKKLPCQEDLEHFFRVLGEEHMFSELIARILWFLNREVYENPEERGYVVTLEMIRKLKIENLIVTSESVALNVQNIYFPLFITSYLPTELFQRIFQLSQQTDMYIFRNRNGSPIDDRQVARNFAIASKKAGLMEKLTPKYLC
jgi:hypothetical protein